jgi:HK97 family phage major capsid protein
MREQIKQLRTERVKLTHDARTIIDKAGNEKRELSSEEKKQWDDMMAKVDALGEKVSTLEKQRDADDEADRDEEDLEGDSDRDEGDYDEDRDDDDEDRDDEDEDRDDEEDERSKRLRQVKHAKEKKAKRAGRRTPPGEKRASLQRRANETAESFRNRQRRATPEYRRAFETYLCEGMQSLLAKHRRDISADSDIVGGYLVMPQEFLAKLIKFVDNYVFIREKGTKFTVSSAQSLGAPSLDNDPADADWTSELAVGNIDTTMSFGKRELTPHPLAKRIKISNKLLRLASISSTFSAYDAAAVGSGAEGLVRSRLGYKFAVAEEKAFLLGNGAQQPLGLFTASARGIDTSRDVVTGLTNGFTADCFFTAKWSLKAPYQPTAEWLFHRNAMPLIQTLKDANGQYMWKPGIQENEPDILVGKPVNVSEYVPNTFTTGQYVGLYGDLSYYWIADSEQMVIQRLVELYAEANQVGFIARRELDGMPVLAEAFARLKFS